MSSSRSTKRPRIVRFLAHLDRVLSSAFITHLVSLPYQFFLQRSTGDLMTRLNSNVTVREILTTGAVTSVLDGVMVAAYLILIFAQSASMGTVVLGLAGVAHDRDQVLHPNTTFLVRGTYIP